MDFSDIRGFCDLYIDNEANIKMLDRVISFGYKVIALNWTIDESSYEPGFTKKKQKGESQPDIVPVPFEESQKHKDLLMNYTTKLKIFKRLTVIISKPEQLKRTLTSKNLRNFDILSVLPKTQAAFQYVCGLTHVDIISFEVGLTEYKAGGKLYRQVVERGGYFELSYAQGLKSKVQRQELITMAHFFHIYGKSKNLIISSGASQVLELRNPYDVANLALLFGLTEEQGKCALSSTCRRLILQIGGKRLGKTAFTIERIFPNKSEDNQNEESRLTDRQQTDSSHKIEGNLSELADENKRLGKSTIVYNQDEEGPCEKKIKTEQSLG